MSLPVRPPILPSDFPMLATAPPIAGPAEDETRDSPCDALDATFEAVSRPLAAASAAVLLAFDVSDWKRSCWRATNWAGRRSVMRDAVVADMVGGWSVRVRRGVGEAGAVSVVEAMGWS
jgi:hypothetical protein